ncbi:hypothetical protein BC829DRAFT_182262 [Chytridium lagenaria]|nr:hypothetical protein BC829DRAFT_182262 [Chytridium lagenaria]
MSLAELRNEGAANLKAAAAAGGARPTSIPADPVILEEKSPVMEEAEEEEEPPTPSPASAPMTPTKSSGWFSWGSSAPSAATPVQSGTTTSVPLVKKASRQSLFSSMSKPVVASNLESSEVTFEAPPDTPLEMTPVDTPAEAVAEVEAPVKPQGSLGKRLDEIVNKRASVVAAPVTEEVPVPQDVKEEEETPLTPPSHLPAPKLHPQLSQLKKKNPSKTIPPFPLNAHTVPPPSPPSLPSPPLSCLAQQPPLLQR